jgi:hypothetical protein
MNSDGDSRQRDDKIVDFAIPLPGLHVRIEDRLNLAYRVATNSSCVVSPPGVIKMTLAICFGVTKPSNQAVRGELPS